MPNTLHIAYTPPGKEQMLNDIYGLSCIENQILTILKSQGYNISYFYANSGIWLQELISFFVTKKNNCEYFNQIPFIQSMLKRMGIITLELKVTKNIEVLLNDFKLLKNNQYLLICTNTKKCLFNQYRAVNTFFNDYPLKHKNFTGVLNLSKCLPTKQLKDIYCGQYYLLNILKEQTKYEEKFLWENRLYKPENYKFISIYWENILNNSNLMLELSDFIWVYKITRYRLIAYYKNYLDMSNIENCMKQVEFIHTRLKYYSLRKKLSFNKVLELLHCLEFVDKQIMCSLKVKLEVYKNAKCKIGS